MTDEIVQSNVRAYNVVQQGYSDDALKVRESLGKDFTDILFRKLCTLSKLERIEVITSLSKVINKI